MKRKEIEIFMKKNNLSQLDVIYKADDKLAMYCSLKGGILHDCWGHRLDRNAEFWGFLTWQNGKSFRKSFTEEVAAW